MKPTTYFSIVLVCTFMVLFISYNIMSKVPKNTIQNSVVLKEYKPQDSTVVINKCYFYPGIDEVRICYSEFPIIN